MRKRFKIPLILFGIVILAILAILVWVTQTDWLKNRATRELNSALAGRAKLRVGIGGLEGDLLSGFTLTDFVLTTRDQRVDTLVIIPSLIVEYNVGELWQSRTVRSVVIDSPHFFIPRDSLTAYFASLTESTDEDVAAGGSGFAFSVEHVVLQNGSVSYWDSVGPILDSLNLLLAVKAEEALLDIHLHDGTANSGAMGPLTASGRFVRQAGRWAVDSLTVTTEKSRLHANMKDGRWQVQAQPFDFRDLMDLIGVDIEGRVDFDGSVYSENGGGAWGGEGRLSGVLEGFELEDVNVTFSFEESRLCIDTIIGYVNGTYWNGSGEFDFGATPEKYTYIGAARGFDLRRWVDDAYPTALSGLIRCNGSGLSNESLRLDLDVALAQGHFNRFALDSAWGGLAVTSEDVIFENDFKLRREGTYVTGGGRIGYRDTMDVLLNFDCRDLRPWDSLVFVDSLEGRADGYLYFSGPTDDPNLTGRVLSDSIRLYDITTSEFEGWFYAPQFLTRPTGHVDVRMGAASVWGWDVDSILVRLGLSGHKVTIDSAAVGSPGIVVKARGHLDWSSDTIPIALHPLTLRWEEQEFAAADTVRLAGDSSGFTLSQLSVESEMGDLEATGRIGFNDSLDLQFSIGGVPIGPTWKRLFPDIDLDGQLACTGSLGGSLDAPNVTLEGGVRNLTYERLPLGDLSGIVSYWDRRLLAEPLRLEHQDYDATLTGSFPLSLSFVPLELKVLDEPLTGHLSATGEALDMAAYFLPETIESIRGPFSISGTLGGTPRVPQVTGDAYLRSGVIKTVEIANPIENVQVDLALKQDTIEIKRAVGTVRDKNRKGSLSAGGTLRILGYTEFDYDLILEGRKVPARFESEDFYVEADFDLTVRGITPPLVEGQILPKRVEDQTSFTEEEIAVVADTTAWDWDMTVQLPGNYWIRNEQIDAELSADLLLLRDRGRFTYLGTAEIIRGKVYLFDKIGRIKRGVLTFDDVNEPDPQLDIDVGFHIRQARPEQALAGEGTQTIELDLHVGGRASEPLIQPEPPYTEQDVLLLLAANRTFNGDDPAAETDPWANRLKFAATGLLFSEVQRLAARTLGLETLEINSADDPNDTQITVGRYFSPHLYLYGTSLIDVGGGQEVGFEYRLNRRLYLEGNRDRDNLYRLNIHFNWDY